MAELQSLPLIDAALRGLLVGLLGLLALAQLRERPRLAAARAGIAIALGLCVQVVGSAPAVESALPRLWLAPLLAVSVGNSVLFWIFVRALFDDAFALRGADLVIWCAVAALSAANCVWLGASGSKIGEWTAALQRAVPVVFALLAAAAAARNWQTDLVEGRRRLRSFIVVAGAGYALVMVAARLRAPQGRLSASGSTLDIALLAAIVVVVSERMLRLRASDLFPSAAGAASAGSTASAGPIASVASTAVSGPARQQPESRPAEQPDPADERLAAALQRMMSEERAYRGEDLSVATLAARLAVPEYRLRRVIHRLLGHRNFNAFVNRYRIDEARAALADPARREVPVLTIALDSGFQSIGPFNRAFKATTGLTPTDFRRRHIAES
jgi:AraC-like DNA-binding protein